ncbi:MAG: hypothetical protein IPK85_15490 [Gemmatimonadetes bacterium]|nr:hypothetical protein [Gemmatimonadota bacterium]
MRLRAAVLTLVVISCGGETPPPPADSTAMPDVVILDTAVAPVDGCRKDGLWQWCSVLDRLDRAGVVLTPRDSVPVNDLLHGQRRTFTVGAGEDELHVFLYESDAARRQDTGAIDSATVSPKGERRSYRVQPLLVTSNNLAALVFTMNERTSERLSLALSAGLPQPTR